MEKWFPQGLAGSDRQSLVTREGLLAPQSGLFPKGQLPHFSQYNGNVTLSFSFSICKMG